MPVPATPIPMPIFPSTASAVSRAPSTFRSAAATTAPSFTQAPFTSSALPSSVFISALMKRSSEGMGPSGPRRLLGVSV